MCRKLYGMCAATKAQTHAMWLPIIAIAMGWDPTQVQCSQEVLNAALSPCDITETRPPGVPVTQCYVATIGENNQHNAVQVHPYLSVT